MIILESHMNLKRQYLLSFLFGMFGLLVYSPAISQTGGGEIIVKGKIIGAESQKPLAFATINILGTPRGVVSNFMGDFVFRIPSAHAKDTLYVSMLGYHPRKMVVNNAKTKPRLTIVLQERAIMLDEVEVNTDQLSARKIVENVIENIPVNYTTSPYLLECFGRFYKSECGEYKFLYEATFDLYGEGYTKGKRHKVEKIYLKETRQTARTKYMSVALRVENNGVATLRFANDLLTKIHSLNLSKNVYEQQEYTLLDNRLVYVIKAKAKRGWENNINYLYVDAESFALLKSVWQIEFSDNERPKRQSSDSTWEQSTSILKTVEFKKEGNKYYPKYFNTLVAGKIFRNETNEELCTWAFQTEMVVNKINADSVKEPPPEELMQRVGLGSQLKPYNAAFWENYQTLKDFPITDQAVKDLSKSADLDTQFRNSYDEAEELKAARKKKSNE